jgi:hypothetical protein
MRIETRNDGKRRRQSVEAEVVISDSTYLLEARGYGENEDEAVANLKETLKEVIKICEEMRENQPPKAG